MTEAGEKWVAEQKASGDILRYASPSAEIAAEFWLRAFCDEVEKRADSYYKHATPEARGFAFDHLRRELLGESTE